MRQGASRSHEKPRASETTGQRKKLKKEHSSSALLSSIVRPDTIRFEPDKVCIQDQLNRVLMAAGYPRNVKEGFLDKLIKSKGDFDITLHITPSSTDATLVNLNRLLRKLNADKYAAEKKGIYTPSIDLLIRDTRRILEEIQEGKEKLFRAGLYVNVKAFDEANLDASTRQAESILNSMMIVPKKPTYRMREGMQSMMPLARDRLGVTRTLTTSALSACFPFTSSFLNQDDTGVMLATNLNNGIPIIRDFFNFMNSNCAVLGSSGGGKSYCVKLILVRAFMAGAKVFIIDPQAEYLELTKALDGQIVDISKDSETIINLLDMLGQPFDEKRLSLVSAYRVMFPGMDDLSLALFDRATSMAYAERGILLHNSETWSKEPPIIGDVFTALERCREDARPAEEERIAALSTRLEQYTKGSFAFLNKRTKLDLEKDFICFDIRRMPNTVQPLMMYLILEFIYARMQKDRSRKILAIDEAWSLLNHAGSAEYLFRMVKTSRKFNLGLFMITQEVNDLLGSDAGRAVLANTSCKYLLKQDPSVIDELVNVMSLTQEERSILLTCGLGEGILIADGERFPIKVIASDKEDSLITTKADDLHKREQEVNKNEHA